MSEQSFLSRLVQKIKSKKHIEIIIAVIAVAIMLVLYFSVKTGDKSETATAAGVDTYCEKMETQLADVIGSISGAGKTKIIVNWESSTEAQIAYVTQTSGSNITSTPQLITSQGSSGPVIIKEIYPKAKGVIVVCEGGGNVKIKLDIITAVSTLLDITSDKINVYAMGK